MGIAGQPLSTCNGTAQSVLGAFLRAFSRLDLDAMLDCVAPEATAFLPGEYHATRLQGKGEIGNAFARVIARLRATGATNLPFEAQELLVQEWGDTAAVTFHLRGEHLSRRTFLLRRGATGWHIVHLHASNATLEE
jgi:ketosteroid isomerase-like protein